MDKALSVAAYMKQTGLSRPKVKGMIERGELRTTGGERPKILLTDNKELEEIKELLTTLLEEVRASNEHLGVRKPTY